jgi:TetR/AcrR family transcriptional regulator, regulator of cefoperazone and chloramphenicol sensitivity
MARDASDTRERLLRSAEHVFARSGIDAPIREIHLHAGQRNASAVQYHFGSKQELVREIIARHAITPEERSVIQADLRSRRDDPRSLVEAMVRRMVGYLRDETDRDFVRIAFQLLIRSPIRRDVTEGVERPDLVSFDAELDMLHSALPQLPERVLTERAVAGVTFVTLQVAERARVIDDEPGGPILDEEEFVANLVDMTAGLLTAPAAVTTAI